MNRPAPMIPVPVTAAELRALAGLHDRMSDAYTESEHYVDAADAATRAILLRRLADDVGPAAEQADGLLGVEA